MWQQLGAILVEAGGMKVVGFLSLHFDACLSKGTRQEHSGKCTSQLRVDTFDSQGSLGIFQHTGNMLKNCILWMITCHRAKIVQFPEIWERRTIWECWSPLCVANAQRGMIVGPTRQ